MKPNGLSRKNAVFFETRRRGDAEKSGGKEAGRARIHSQVNFCSFAAAREGWETIRTYNCALHLYSASLRRGVSSYRTSPEARHAASGTVIDP